MYTIERTDEEIEDLLDKVVDSFNNGTNFPGMSYEQGIMYAIQWLTGQSDDNPLSE
jgi:hypothetical protein